MRPLARIPARIAHAYRTHVHASYRRRAALRLWLFFLLTFLVLRFITYGIHYHFLPLHDVVTGGLHIHHFVWGIAMLILLGVLLVSLEAPKWHPRLAIFLGIACALVIDEFALWLNLTDNYWQQAGRTSVDVAVVIAALFGIYYAANRFWNQVARELHAGVRLAVSGEQRLLRRRHREALSTETSPAAGDAETT